MTSPLLSQLQKAKNALEDAQYSLCGAVSAHSEAKRTLELAEAHALVAGIDGKNEKERAARLRLELASEYTALHEAEDTLSEARCAFDAARLEWDLVRYQVRMLEAGSEIGNLKAA